MGEHSLSVKQLPRTYVVEVSLGFFSSLTYRSPCKNVSQPLVFTARCVRTVQCRRQFSIRKVVAGVWNRRMPTEVAALQLRITPVTEIHILTQTEQEVECLVTKTCFECCGNLFFCLLNTNLDLSV
jgi:hypothetical protein